MVFFTSLSRRLFVRSSPLYSSRRSINTNFTTFQEGDRVILSTVKSSIFTKPLEKNQTIDVRGGYVEHNNIIGARVRDTVRTHNARGVFRITHPTLEEYVTHTSRLVTPIYAADANLIVSLLDIHTAPPGEEPDEEPLEILEAGTGHGSLTLHLARAISGSNTRAPPIPLATQRRTPGQDESTPAEPESAEEERKQRDWDAWRANRNAIIHTVEVSSKVSRHAEKVVRGFRRGIYAGNVDFYVDSAEDWIQRQIEIRSSKLDTHEKFRPFLSYAILDMPGADSRVAEAARVLKPDGLLVIFAPSITQIGDCVKIIRDQCLPLVMSKVVELGMGLSGGRQWDVRTAVVRATLKPTASQAEAEASSSGVDDASVDASSDEASSIQANESDIRPLSKERAMSEADSVKHATVCRPKVGDKIVGGGFVGIWRMGRKRDTSSI